MNPRDYDLSELDAPVEEAGRAANGPPGGSVRPDDLIESNQYRELMMLESTAGDLEKPYLEGVPEAYAAELAVFEWLDFLVERAGFRGALDALRYYRTIDWLTADAEDQLREYLQSFDDPDDAGSELDRSDHVLSLVYIARLSSMG